MKKLLSKWTVVGLIMVFAAACSVLFAQGAEKKKISGSAKSIYIGPETTASIGDVPGHKIGMAGYVYTQTSSDPDWNNSQVFEYEQYDDVAGTGSHRGYDVELLGNGDKTYSKYEGTHKMVKEGPDWEIAGEGKFQYTGGTGKYKNIKGSGTYKSKATRLGDSSQLTIDWEMEIRY